MEKRLGHPLEKRKQKRKISRNWLRKCKCGSWNLEHIMYGILNVSNFHCKGPTESLVSDDMLLEKFDVVSVDLFCSFSLQTLLETECRDTLTIVEQNHKFNPLVHMRISTSSRQRQIDII